MNQKGDESFSFLLGENSGIHQEARQTPRHGASDRAGPQAPSADEDLTLRRGSGAKSRKTCFAFLFLFLHTYRLASLLDYSASEVNKRELSEHSNPLLLTEHSILVFLCTGGLQMGL